MTQTFDEKFPGLKGKVERLQSTDDNGFFEYVETEDIEEHCTDDMILKETIDTLRKKHDKGRNTNELDAMMHEGAYLVLGDLLKELGLKTDGGTEMTQAFDEKFPSMERTNYLSVETNGNEIVAKYGQFISDTLLLHQGIITVGKEMLSAKCLDKQRVRNAISRQLSKKPEDTSYKSVTGIVMALEEIQEELGL